MKSIGDDKPGDKEGTQTKSEGSAHIEYGEGKSQSLSSVCVNHPGNGGMKHG